MVRLFPVTRSPNPSLIIGHNVNGQVASAKLYMSQTSFIALRDILHYLCKLDKKVSKVIFLIFQLKFYC